MLLSDKTIKQAKPEARPYKLADGDGLYLLVKPSGSKLWRMKYHFAGKENVLSMGKYPLVSLIEARDCRYHTKKLLLENIDPNGQKKEEKRAVLLNATNSFFAVAQDWHNTNKKKWTPDHAEKLWRRLELHAMRTIGTRPITEIKTPELVQLVRKLEKANKHDTAKRLAQSFTLIFRFALHSGLIEHSPASDLRGITAPHQSVHYPAVHPLELPELLRRLEQVSTTEQNRLAIKLLLHTFVRPGELRYGRWDEIDWQAKQWIIPPERMKKRRQHRVPLSDAALSLLDALKPISGYSDYLFPSQQRQRHPIMSENTINKILQTMGYGGRQVGHGFRAIASTILNESGLFRPDVIEMQLAHVESNNSRRPYNRAEYMEERTHMMAWWSNYLQTEKYKTSSSDRQVI